MKQLKLLSAVLIACILCLGAFAATAATLNPSPASTGYQIMVLPIQGTYSSTAITAAKFKAPFPYRVIAASATARDVTGTNPTLTVDVKTGSTSVFSTPVAVTAGAIADAVLTTTPKLTDEGTVSVILAAGGTLPKWRDITLTLVLKRL
ncbi:MAG TPA: hypothetical protein DCP69_08025 [Candidatus Omnitrophica bacterium]|nr:hypothetical protein [Candidatus Omnitrophota bacterium]